MSTQKALSLFDKIYNETYDDVLKYVICNIKSLADAEDIMQNIYLNVLKKIQNDDSFIFNKSYLYGIAKHKIKDFYRFKYKVKIVSLFSNENIDLVDTISDDFNLEDITINNDNLDKIWDFLKKKKIIIGRIFFLYYYENYSIKEISNVLNISESNVKNYIYRTLHELNDYLMKGDEYE